MSHAPRVVFDTNVVLSALVFRGVLSASLRELWRSGACRPLACADTVTELLRVLAYPKFRLREADREELLAEYLPYAEAIGDEAIEQAYRLGLPYCRDPHDGKFIALAAAARADLLVTGDRDLLVLADEIGVPVIPPAEFVERVESGRSRK